MKNIERTIKSNIEKRLNSGRAIVVLGPRQVGKTTLLKSICETIGSYKFFDADQPTDRTLLQNQDLPALKQAIGNEKLVFIDEAQRVKNIGLTLKIIIDQLPDVQLLVSGSSSLELSNEISEPLTGRKWEFNLYPISWGELVNSSNSFEAQKQLPIRLIYGMYPDVINFSGDEITVLNELTSSYLYRDLLQYEAIRKPQLISKLLTALAFQLGNEVSLNELAQLLEVAKETVNTYIDLLEKAFIIFRLQPLSRNLRNEINTNRKIYFYDNGVRNAIIGDFKPVNLRQDMGALWENFLISERMKKLRYENSWAKTYFWRTYQQQEIDYVEEKDGEFFAYEIKWNAKSKKKFPTSFIEAYKPKIQQVIHPDNFMEFLG